jgi:hypothetical protein
MKTPRLILSLIAISSTASFSQGAGIIQTFEPGDDQSAWGPGSIWDNGVTVEGFLAQSFGGDNAGGGGSAVQGFSRVFRNSTVVDVSTAYTISLYVQLDEFDGPNSGQFEIMDGAFGSSTANVRIRTDNAGGTPTYHWEALHSGGPAVDLGLEFTVGSPYRVEFTVDPETLTYATTINLVNVTGDIIDTGSASDLSFSQNVINNNQNGELRFYVQAASGNTGIGVDNINIDNTANIPEPVIPGIVAGSVLVFALGRRRPCVG